MQPLQIYGNSQFPLITTGNNKKLRTARGTGEEENTRDIKMGQDGPEPAHTASNTARNNSY